MDATAFFLLHHERAHGVRIDEILEGLAEDELRRRPHPALNSIAWLLWPIARTEDMSVNRFVADHCQVLDDEECMPRLNVPRRDMGEGMTLDEVDELSERVDLTALRGYWDAVGRRTTTVLRRLAPNSLDDIVDALLVRRVVFDEGAVAGAIAPRLCEHWCGMSRGYVLGYMGLTHSYEHLGDMGSIRGMLGYRGRF